MEENRYGINWLGLFIKVIVFVVIVLLAIWLISKITLKNKGLSFEENNKMFQDAAVEYFKKNLPKNKEEKSVTLSQLINWNYLEKIKNEDGKTCDVKNSKSKIEIVEDYYSIKNVLVCGNKSKTTYVKLGNEDCVECDIKVEGLKAVSTEESNEGNEEENKETTKEESNNPVETNKEASKGSTPNGSTNNQSTNTSQTILYEYVKEMEEYSDWYVGKVTGNNIENSIQKISYSNYCRNEEYTYYTTGYVTNVMNYSYKLELKNLSNISGVKLKDTSYFTNSSDYQKYLDNKYKDLQMVGATNYYLPNANTIEKSALNKNNFVFSVSKVYEENGKFYVDVVVDVKNLHDVIPYYLSSIKDYIYYVPIKFTVSYVNENSCVVDKTTNSNNYNNYIVTNTWTENVDVYRYKLITKEYKFSSATSLEGYKKTGNTKLAG